MTDRRSGGLTSTLWLSTQFGTLSVVGSAFASLLGGPAAARRAAKQQFGPHHLSTMTATAAALVCGLVLNRLIRVPSPFEWVWQAGVVMAAVAVYCAVKGRMTFATMSLASRSDTSWMDTALRDSRNAVMVASAAALLVQAMSHQQWGLLAFVLLPLYFVFRAVSNVVQKDQIVENREAVIESLHEGVCVVDLDGRIATWNAALERMLNCPRAQAIGQSLGRAVPMLADTSVANAVGAAIAGGSDSGVLRLMLPAAAGAAVLQVRIVPSRRNVMLIWQDVTNDTRTDRALRQSEARFALLESSISDGLWEWDLQAGSIRFSAQWRNIVGLPPTSTTGSPDVWFDRVHEEDRDLLTEAIEAYVSGRSRC
jgi:PAS domain-containing protein